MAKVITTLPHLRNETVIVNGSSYPIDSDGVACVTSADAAKLLQIQGWEDYSSEALAERAAKKQRIAAKFKVTLKDDSGQPIDVAPPADNPPAEAQQDGAPEAEQAAPVDPPIGAPSGDQASVPKSEPDPQPSEPASADVHEQDADAEEEDPDEWPDPDVSMKKEYLIKMAKAYELEPKLSMNKQQLVDMITEAMYG
jgi:hypothetical protein